LRPYDVGVGDFDYGRVGIWTRSLDRLPMARAQDQARTFEALGFRTLWVPEVIGREPLVHAALLLDATEQLVVGAGVANVHARSAMAMQSAWKTLSEAFPERFVLGLGVSQAPIVEGLHRRSYGEPYRTMVDYLDAMDGATFVGIKPSSPPRRILAALRPRLLRLAAERASGAITYFVPIEHTAWARDVLGPESALLVEQAVVMDSDPTSARDLARRYMATYLAIPLYADRLRELGWKEDDVAGPSDALVDAIVAWGSPADIAKRLRAHLDAGADHVAVQIVPTDERTAPVEQWRELADVVQQV
jgi:probable F420-dependent oxidoreductase